ncbi:MAG: hypothetical protein JRN11_07550 [Nitrososphaerota archaeon]|nr:hypothetical protein [Nitrososphaerota archaeon]MDG7026586.1 hypothetical protein [Nitrososphaerota archaeon]
MKAVNWVAALVSWAFGVWGVFAWFTESTAAPMIANASARDALVSRADLLLAVGAAGMALNVAFLARGELESRRAEEL